MISKTKNRIACVVNGRVISYDLITSMWQSHADHKKPPNDNRIHCTKYPNMEGISFVVRSHQKLGNRSSTNFMFLIILCFLHFLLLGDYCI